MTHQSSSTWRSICTLGHCLLLAAASCSDDSAKTRSQSDNTATPGSYGKDAQVADTAVPTKPEQPADPVDASWTMMGHDSSNSYFQPHETQLNVENAKDLQEHWRYRVQGFPTGSPVVVSGKVYISATGGLSAVDLKTGEELWSQPAIMGTSTPAYQDGFLYMHAAAGAGLYKVNADDGSIVWGPVPTYPENPRCDGTSSAIVAGDKILVGHSCGAAEVTGGEAQANARGGVEALSTRDGERLWTYWTVDDDETGAMVWSSVSIDLEASVVYATTGNNYTVAGANSDAIHAIDLETGKRLWVKQVREGDLWSLGGGITATGEDTDFGANPILAESDGKPIVAAGDKGSAFWALDRNSGEIVWSREDLSAAHSPSNGGVLMNGAYDGKYFYVASNEPPSSAVVHVLDAKDGSDVFEPIRLDATVWGATSVANGLLFVPANSVLHIYNAATGEKLNSFDTGGTIAAGAAAVVDGHVIVKSGLRYQFARDALNNNEVICYALGEPTRKPDAPDPEAKPESAAPTWSAVYTDIIVGTGCAGSALCHGGEAGKLLLKDRASSYAALVNIKAMGVNSDGSEPHCADSDVVRVVPGKPDESLLLQKMEEKQTCGLPMPPTGKLSDAQISQVRRWIEAGAKDD